MTEWFEGLDAEHLAHAEAKGWKGPLTPEVATGMLQAHRAAERLIGSDPAALLKLPKDASDPSYQGILDRVVGLSLPKDAAEYKFDGIAFKDGSPLDEADVAFVRDFAVKNKLPVQTARAFAAELASRAEAQFDTANANSSVATAARDAALRGSWSSEYDQKAFSASKAIDALKAIGINVSDGAGLSNEQHVAHMNGLVQLSAQLNEASILRGGGRPSDPTSGMSPESALARFNERKDDRNWAMKALTPGTEEAKEFGNLQALIARGRVSG